MAQNNTKTLGEIGEDLAADYLKQNKYKILARNWRKKWGEIDIIARRRKTIVFVEVKALDAAYKNFKPEEHFDWRKQQKMIRACHSWLLANNYPEDTDYRIDLAALEMNKDARMARLRYYKNVGTE